MAWDRIRKRWQWLLCWGQTVVIRIGLSCTGMYYHNFAIKEILTSQCRTIFCMTPIEEQHDVTGSEFLPPLRGYKFDVFHNYKQSNSNAPNKEPTSHQVPTGSHVHSANCDAYCQHACFWGIFDQEDTTYMTCMTVIGCMYTCHIRHCCPLLFSKGWLRCTTMYQTRTMVFILLPWKPHLLKGP